MKKKNSTINEGLVGAIGLAAVTGIVGFILGKRQCKNTKVEEYEEDERLTEEFVRKLTEKNGYKKLKKMLKEEYDNKEGVNDLRVEAIKYLMNALGYYKIMQRMEEIQEDKEKTERFYNELDIIAVELEIED